MWCLVGFARSKNVFPLCRFLLSLHEMYVCVMCVFSASLLNGWHKRGEWEKSFLCENPAKMSVAMDNTIRL